MNTTIDITTDILTNDGHTWSANDTDVPTTGYMVSLPDYEAKVPVDAFNPGELATYVMITAEVVADRDDLFYGAWIDGGYVYLDISQHIASKQEALIAADLHDQLAIYDLTDQVPIFTSGNDH